MEIDQKGPILRQLLTDELRRDRDGFVYTSDVLVLSEEYLINFFDLPNTALIPTTGGIEINNNLRLTPEDDLRRLALLEKQKQMIDAQNGNTPLCEAFTMAPCLREDCSLFDEKIEACKEFKIAFVRK